MEKVLISIPDRLAARLRATIPSRQRSKVITHLIEEEVQRRERTLYECALAVEQDAPLQEEMAEWDITLDDGLHQNKKGSFKNNLKTKKQKQNNRKS